MRAAGLSLVFPGGGFLYLASRLWFLVTMVLLALAIVLWWGISAHWAIPLVWLGSAVASGLLADVPRLFVDEGTTWPWAIPVVYLLAVAAVTVALVRTERTHRRKLAKVPELNEYLSTAALPHREPDPNAPSEFDAELVGWVYDMALQPLDQFNGFDWGEQIHGPTCVRYQVNMVGYALAVYAANQLPNCPQPVEAALANVILKATDLRVWATGARSTRSATTTATPTRSFATTSCCPPTSATRSTCTRRPRAPPGSTNRARWRSCGRTAAPTSTTTDPRRRPDALRRFGADRRHDTEAAIRAWARSSPQAAEVQRRIDNNRRAYLADTRRALGIDGEHAESFAELGVLVIAGSQNLCGPVDRALVERVATALHAEMIAAIPATVGPER